MSTDSETSDIRENAEANKSRKVAIALAFIGVLPLPLPVAWIHKFYLGQYLWGIVYLILAPTGLPKVACCLEGLWYASQNDEDFEEKFPTARATLSAATALTQPSTFPVSTLRNVLKGEFSISDQAPPQPSASPTALLRDLDQLRQEGLITEYEFEQKRRKLLEQIR